MPSASAQLDHLLLHLSGDETLLHELDAEDLHWLDAADDEEVRQLLMQLAGLDPSRIVAVNLAGVLRHLVYRLQPWMKAARKTLPADIVPVIAHLYKHLGKQHASRAYLLQMLTSSGEEDELEAFIDLVISDPPNDASAVMLAFGPLFQHTDYDPATLFPRLLDAIAQPTVAASVIDLANFLTRQGLLDVHPGSQRKEQLMQLLGAIVQQLEQIEETPDEVAESRAALMQQIEDGVALGVALCDALALIGDKEAIGKLYQAFEIRHRRLRTEAAAALARFDEQEGEDALIRLAAEPVARLRVLAYADELGFGDKIDDQYRTAAARAEAELALWLGQPSQMGIPPSQLELVDAREQYWPSYDEPLDCYLFRFTYQVGEAQFSNVGIAGPITHAFGADLQDLPPDDIYAAFAGWQAEHEDIYEQDVTHLNESQRVDVAKLERRLRDDHFDAIQPTTLAMFLGDKVLAARATREGHAGIAITDGQESLWFASRNPERPIRAAEALCIYKGRRLLRSFN